MHCPCLYELPPPPNGRSGWPWTVESLQLPDTMSDGRPWPRISIITPSYNQGRFIEETIRSVLLQGYPNLEYIVIDGGSSDGSVEVLRKYAPWLSYWVSEADRGQSHAINKGVVHASGEIGNWINSDDILKPSALERVATHYVNVSLPDAPALVAFSVDIVDHKRQFISNFPATLPASPADFLGPFSTLMAQPGTFIHLPSLNTREELQYVMDWELYFRLHLQQTVRFFVVEESVAEFRSHPTSKTEAHALRFMQEKVDVVERLSAQYPRYRKPMKLWVRRERGRLSLHSRAGSLTSAALLPLTTPQLLIDRMFWGRLRRLISGAS